MVYVVNNGREVIACRSGNDNLLGAGLDMGRSLFLGSIEAGAFEDDVNAEFEKAGVKDVEASKAEFIADGRMPAVRESIRRSKAVDHLVENAKVTEVDETAKDAE